MSGRKPGLASKALPNQHVFQDASIKSKKRQRVGGPPVAAHVPDTPVKPPSVSRNFGRHVYGGDFNTTSALDVSSSDATSSFLKHQTPASAVSSSSVTRLPLPAFPNATGPAPPSPSPSIFDNDFDVLGVIGKGTFGEVYHVRSRVDLGEYAVKKSLKKFRGQNDRLRALKEVENFCTLGSNRYCVKYCRAWEDDGHCFIQTEYCPHGSLKRYLSFQEGPIPEEHVWLFLADMVLALNHIHEKHRLHLDIKGDNVLLAADGFLKLGDFGLSIEIEQLDKLSMEGDSAYCAPELLDRTIGQPGPACDIFSLGILGYEMATHVDLPQNGEGWHRLRNEEPSLWARASFRSAELRDLIASMMRRKPSERPTAAQLRAHPSLARWIAKENEPRNLAFPPPVVPMLLNRAPSYGDSESKSFMDKLTSPPVQSSSHSLSSTCPSSAFPATSTPWHPVSLSQPTLPFSATPHHPQPFASLFSSSTTEPRAPGRPLALIDENSRSSTADYDEEPPLRAAPRNLIHMFADDDDEGDAVRDESSVLKPSDSTDTVVRAIDFSDIQFDDSVSPAAHPRPRCDSSCSSSPTADGLSAVPHSPASPIPRLEPNSLPSDAIPPLDKQYIRRHSDPHVTLAQEPSSPLAASSHQTCTVDSSGRRIEPQRECPGSESRKRLHISQRARREAVGTRSRVVPHSPGGMPSLAHFRPKGTPAGSAISSRMRPGVGVVSVRPVPPSPLNSDGLSMDPPTLHFRVNSDDILAFETASSTEIDDINTSTDLDLSCDVSGDFSCDTSVDVSVMHDTDLPPPPTLDSPAHTVPRLSLRFDDACAIDEASLTPGSQPEPSDVRFTFAMPATASPNHYVQQRSQLPN